MQLEQLFDGAVEEFELGGLVAGFGGGGAAFFACTFTAIVRVPALARGGRAVPVSPTVAAGPVAAVVSAFTADGDCVTDSVIEQTAWHDVLLHNC